MYRVYINGKAVNIQANLYYELKDEARRKGISIQELIQRLYKGEETGRRYYYQKTNQRRKWLD